MPGADGMSSKFMKNAFVGWTFTAGLYYPPDFDQSKLMPLKHIMPKGDKMMNIRMMFPFTMICDECKEYNYTGTKFTAKVEHIKSEGYMGIKVWRFYGRCRHCWSEFTFKTDPKNSDYTMESGGKRTYEAWKDADMMESEMKKEKEKEAEQDQMKALEQKSIDVQAEMQRLEDLDAIRTMNKRLGARDQTIEEALEFLSKQVSAEAIEEKTWLAPKERAEMDEFKMAQEERKRKLVDDEVEGVTGDTPAASSSSGLGSSSSAASGDGYAARAKSLIDSAIADRASEKKAPTVGARFSVKRKADAPDDSSSKAQKTSTTTTTASASTAACALAGGSSAGASAGGIGLGSYDSDSS